MKPKLLVSVKHGGEAIEAAYAGVDIIDVKNPREGSLGASAPWIIKAVREIVPKEIEVSAAIGDLPNLPGTASLAALGAAMCGVNYVKAGLYGVSGLNDAIYLMSSITKAVKDYDESIKVVAVGYADSFRIGAISPKLIPEVAYQSGADVAMIDTAVKDSKRLLNFMNLSELRNFVKKAHNLGLLAALAGRLTFEDILLLCRLDVDIIGVRGAVCSGGDRLRGDIRRELVAKLVNLMEKVNSVKLVQLRALVRC